MVHVHCHQRPRTSCLQCLCPQRLFQVAFSWTMEKREISWPSEEISFYNSLTLGEPTEPRQIERGKSLHSDLKLEIIFPMVKGKITHVKCAEKSTVTTFPAILQPQLGLFPTRWRRPPSSAWAVMCICALQGSPTAFMLGTHSQSIGSTSEGECMLAYSCGREHYLLYALCT